MVARKDVWAAADWIRARTRDADGAKPRVSVRTVRKDRYQGDRRALAARPERIDNRCPGIGDSQPPSAWPKKGFPSIRSRALDPRRVAGSVPLASPGQR